MDFFLTATNMTKKQQQYALLVSEIEKLLKEWILNETSFEPCSKHSLIRRVGESGLFFTDQKKEKFWFVNRYFIEVNHDYKINIILFEAILRVKNKNICFCKNKKSLFVAEKISLQDFEKLCGLNCFDDIRKVEDERVFILNQNNS